ncbi:MAG TPA: magnesium/cobalt transporter CorA [Longimicrobiales bacterium]|nr:magnesium/cobalt transporter CorA [Longimicrobiales bacterium]
MENNGLEEFEQEHTETGTRHRALIGGPEGVRAASLPEAVALVKAGPAEGGEHVWIDIVRPTDADANLLRHELHFHPLTVEDCMHGMQSPKLERYPGYFFLVMYAARINVERNRPAFYELHCFVGGHYLITVRHESVREVRELMARWRGAPGHYASVGHLAHGIADTLIDSYFPMIDHFSTRVAATETEVYEQPEDAMQHIMSLRRELLRFRGVVAPTREVLSSLLRRDLPFLNPELTPYFQDVREHAVRVTEEIDMLRDLLSTAVEAQFTVTSNQLNQTVRMMTAWSIILMSMSLVAGIYGMNFAHMPELDLRYGYFGSLLVMLVVGGSLVLFFRRRRWL